MKTDAPTGFRGEATGSEIAGASAVIISWTPAPLLAGTPVGAAQLNATANVIGTFTYMPAAGTLFQIGVHPVTATFTPDDQVNYSQVSVSAGIVVYSGTAASTLFLKHISPFNYSDPGGGWVLDPVSNRLYVGMQSNPPQVRVIDLVNGGIERVMPTGGLSARHLELDGGRRRLYVVGPQLRTEPVWSYGPTSLAILDIDTGQLIESIPLPAWMPFPSWVVLHPTTRQLVFIDSSGLTASEWLGTFDPTAAGADRFTAIGSNERVQLAWESFKPAIDPMSNLLYLTETGHGFRDGQLSYVVDMDATRATYGTIVATIPDVTAPYVFDRKRKVVYASRSYTESVMYWYFGRSDPGTISVIDADPASPTVHTVIDRIEVTQPAPATFANALALNPGRDLLYALMGPCNWFVITAGYVDCFPFDPAAVVSVDLASRTVASIRPFESWTQLSSEGYEMNVALIPALDRIVTWPSGNAPAHILIDPRPTTAPVQPASSPDPITVGIATLEFSAITSSGEVTVEAFDPASADLTLPGQFAIEGGIGFEISTTATFTGSIDICFDMSTVTDPDAFAALTILHGEAGAWVPYPTTRNVATGLVCATVPSLSPFVIARLNTSYDTEALFDTSKAFKTGSTVPIKVRLLQRDVNVSSAAVAVNLKRLHLVSTSASFVVQDAGHANPDGNFRFDPTMGGYVFNLSTKGLATGTYELVYTASGDKTYHRLQFQLR